MCSPKPEPPWPSLVVKKGVKDFFLVLGGNAAAIVAHAQAQPPWGGGLRLHGDGATAALAKSVGQGVGNQVHQHLPQGAGVAVELQFGRNVFVQCDGLLAQCGAHRQSDFMHHLVQRKTAPLRAGLVHRQLFEAADQLRRALQIALNDLAALLQVLQVFGQGAAGQAAARLGGKALLGLHQRGGHGHSVANGRIQLVRHTRYQRS